MQAAATSKKMLKPDQGQEATLPDGNASSTGSVSQKLALTTQTSPAPANGSLVLGNTAEQNVLATGGALDNLATSSFMTLVCHKAHVSRSRRMKHGFDQSVPLKVAAILVLRFRRLANTLPLEHWHPTIDRYIKSRNPRRLSMSMITLPENTCTLTAELPGGVTLGISYWGMLTTMLNGAIPAATTYPVRSNPQNPLQVFDENGNTRPISVYQSVPAGAPAWLGLNTARFSVNPEHSRKFVMYFVCTAGVVTNIRIGAWIVDPADPAFGTANQGSALASVALDTGGNVIFDIPVTYTNVLGAVVRVTQDTAISFAMNNTDPFATAAVLDIIFRWDEGDSFFDALAIDTPDADSIDSKSENTRLVSQSIDVKFTGSSLANEGSIVVAVLPGDWFDTHGIEDVTFANLARLPQSWKGAAKDGIHAVLPYCGIPQATFLNTDADIFVSPVALAAPRIAVAFVGTRGPFEITVYDNFELNTESQVFTPQRRFPDPAALEIATAVTSSIPIFCSQEQKPAWDIGVDMAISAVSLAFPRVGAGIELCKIAANAFSNATGMELAASVANAINLL